MKKMFVLGIFLIFNVSALQPLLLKNQQEKVKEIKKETMSRTEARKKVELLKIKVNNIISLISVEKEKALMRLKEDYKTLMENLNRPIPPKDEFETSADYNVRFKKHQGKIKALKEKYKSQYQEIQKKYNTELRSKTKVYNDHIKELNSMKFPAANLEVELIKYNADEELYFIKLTDPEGNIWAYSLSIEPNKARELKKRKELLKAEGYFESLEDNHLSQTILIDPILGRQPFVSKNILRSRYLTLSESDVKSMLKQGNFFDKVFNRTDAFNNLFEIYSIKGDFVVIDFVTGLMWHQSGSYSYMSFKKSKQWLNDLNSRGYAGFSDWRLPTLEEGASLLEKYQKNGDLYIDPIFSRRQKYIWTGDMYGSSAAWVVCFDVGRLFHDFLYPSVINRYVRPVRSAQ